MKFFVNLASFNLNEDFLMHHISRTLVVNSALKSHIEKPEEKTKTLKFRSVILFANSKIDYISFMYFALLRFCVI